MYCSYVFTRPHLFLLLLPIALLQTFFSASSLWKTALHFFQASLLFVAATLVYAWTRHSYKQWKITTAPQPQNSSSCLELACVCTDVELRFATGLKCYTSNPKKPKRRKNAICFRLSLPYNWKEMVRNILPRLAICIDNLLHEFCNPTYHSVEFLLKDIPLIIVA